VTRYIEVHSPSSPGTHGLSVEKQPGTAFEARTEARQVNLVLGGTPSGGQ
jgi:hypothetical protein